MKKTPQANPVAKAECMLSGFFAEHHVPHTQADHLIDVIKRAFPDSETAKKCTVKKTKMSYLVHGGLAHYEEKTIVEICRNQPFSIMIDESTDASTTQVLAIVVRYFNTTKQDVCDALLDSIEVAQATAEGLYRGLKASLEEKKIPITNVIGF